VQINRDITQESDPLLVFLASSAEAVFGMRLFACKIAGIWDCRGEIG